MAVVCLACALIAGMSFIGDRYTPAQAVSAASHVQPRVAPDGSAWAIIGTLSSSRSNIRGIAVDSDDDTVFVGNVDYASEIDVYSAGATTGGRASVITLPFATAEWLAIDSDDDTLYATPANVATGALWRIDAASGVVDDSIVAFVPVLASSGVLGLPVVDQEDDTVYVSTNVSGYGIAAIHGDDTSVTNPVNAMGLTPTPSRGFYFTALNPIDDTVYASAWTNTNPPVNTNVYSFGGSPLASTFDDSSPDGLMGSNPGGLVVDAVRNRVYSVQYFANQIYRMNGSTLAIDDSKSLGLLVTGGLTTDDSASLLFTGSRDPNSFLVIDPNTLNIDDSVRLPGQLINPYGPVTGGNGLFYMPIISSPQSISVIAEISTTPASWSGDAGASLSATLSPRVAARLAGSTVIDDTTVASVSFGDDTVPYIKSGNTLAFAAPAGSGSKAVTASLNGGNVIALGTFTYGSTPPPPPAPSDPPSAPREVSAVAEDSSATATWRAPASSGSFPITNYKATASPGGQTCLVAAPALTCTISGLTNGTAYTFTVEALNGAGWSANSAPSNPITPKPDVTPTILITGYRGTGDATGRVYADGTTTHLAGTTVQARVRVAGQPEYADGSTRAVPAEEAFTWQRRTNKKTYLYFTTEGISSNRIIIQAR
jgi:hypothetical protein